MGSVVALGETDELEGFALAGVRVVAIGTGADALSAWEALDEDVGLVILSSAAAAVLRTELGGRPEILTVVMP